MLIKNWSQRLCFANTYKLCILILNLSWAFKIWIVFVYMYQMFCRKRIPCLAASTKEMRTSRPNKKTPIFFIITTIKFSHLLPKLWFSFGRSTKSAYNLPTQFSFKILLWGSAVHTHTHLSLIAHHRENWFHDSFYLPLKFALSKYVIMIRIHKMIWEKSLMTWAGKLNLLNNHR